MRGALSCSVMGTRMGALCTSSLSTPPLPSVTCTPAICMSTRRCSGPVLFITAGLFYLKSNKQS